MYMSGISQDFYKAVAKEEINKITRKHSFRSMVNQDRSRETGSDIHNKVQRKQNASPINSASLKFALQEHAPGVEAERSHAIKLKQKATLRKDTITGEVSKSPPGAKIEIAPTSQATQAYYNMLVTQQKPFNLRKGNLVTSDRVQRLDLH